MQIIHFYIHSNLRINIYAILCANMDSKIALRKLVEKKNESFKLTIIKSNKIGISLKFPPNGMFTG